MRKLASCARRTSPGDAVAPGCPPPPRSRGSKRGSHDRGSRVAKRAAASQARIPSPQATRPRTLDDLPVPVCCCSSARIPTTWGAKRARSAIGVPWLPVPPPPDPDPIPSASWRDWASLGDGPAGLIAERLLADDVADYVSFRAACRPWRLWSTDPREHGVLDRRFHPRQWTMLRTKRGSPYRRCFMNLSTGYCRYVHLPELRGHDVFGLTTEGLLVLVDRATCVVRLLNPFTRQAADLPPATALMTRSELERRRRDGEDFAEISGAGLAGDRTVAVYFPGITTLAVAKPGDARWTVVDRGTYLSPAMSFAGRFYCATCRAVMVVETSADDQPPRLAVAAELTRPLSGIMMDTVHLVDNGGELTLVDRERMRRGDEHYEVYRVDMDARELVPVRGLGGRAVFVGWERALSVSPSVFPSISADTIYLGFDSLFDYMDDSPVHLMDATFDRRQSKGDDDVPIICGPPGVDLDHCLSWCVTSYRRGYGSKDRC